MVSLLDTVNLFRLFAAISHYTTAFRYNENMSIYLIYSLVQNDFKVHFTSVGNLRLIIGISY